MCVCVLHLACVKEIPTVHVGWCVCVYVFVRVCECECESECECVPEPVAFAGVRVAADGIILVSQPHDEDDVESCGSVIKEF